MPTVLDPVTFTIGLTQWAKDLGLQGWQLRMTGVVIGAVAAYLSLFHVDFWEHLSTMATGFTATGGVSFIGTLIQKFRK